MELHPDADELKLNERLKGFAKDILDNDVLATAVVKRTNESAPRDEGWEFRAGEPSLCLLADGKFGGGIQLGYVKENLEHTSRASRYIYTDFFVINPTTGENSLFPELQEVIQDIDPIVAREMIETAWQLWLSKLHAMVDRVNATPSEYMIVGGNENSMKLFVDKYTGEIAFGYNMPPEHAVEIILPPAGSPFYS